MPPRKFLNFRSSEIDSGAFWGDFQHGKARVQAAIVAANLFCIYVHAERSIELRPNLDLIPAARTSRRDLSRLRSGRSYARTT